MSSEQIVDGATGLDRLRSIIELATADEWAAGVQWYREARSWAQELAAEYSLDLAQVLGVTALFSNGSWWARNKESTRTFIDAWSRAEPVGVGQLSLWATGWQRDKALRVLDDRDLGCITGPKVRPFYDNLTGAPDDVTIDRHAYNAWLGERRIVGNDGPTVPGGAFEPAQEDYRALAEELSLEPREAQAVVWVVWKRLIGQTQ